MDLFDVGIKVLWCAGFLFAGIIPAGKLIYKWLCFRKEGLTAVAKIQKVRRLRNKDIADIVFVDSLGRTVNAAISIPAIYSAIGMDIQVTYRKNLEKCCLGDERAFPALRLIALIFLWSIFFLFVFTGFSKMSIAGGGVLLFCLFPLLLRLNHVAAKNRKTVLEHGVCTEGIVDHVTLDAERMRVQLHYTAWEQPVSFDAQRAICPVQTPKSFRFGTAYIIRLFRSLKLFRFDTARIRLLQFLKRNRFSRKKSWFRPTRGLSESRMEITRSFWLIIR